MRNTSCPIVFFICSLLLFVSCGVKKSYNDRPDISGIESIDTTRIKLSEDHYKVGKNQLRKNKYGIWEMYLEGNALERGLAQGSLSRELLKKQETAFMEQIESRVPSKSYRNFLKKAVAWFNRKMYLHVPEEYKQEIYGVSRFAPSKYKDFAPAYLRNLYYHAAHDIGHALQDLMLVGCTSFAAWGPKTKNGDLLIGRNFDFYAGDAFSEEKIAAFINPDQGHKFMMYTWPGMVGNVSGMNEKGISVTINAGKSKIPLQAKTPISLVAREILQYAATTVEAIEIAKKREVFVAEAVMVGSGSEGKAILIEMAPKNFGVYKVTNSTELICSNHFQSEAFVEDSRNKKTIAKSHTVYRYKRLQELLYEKQILDPKKAVNILRNKEGMEGENIGLGNEKAINQLLAHHGIVFQPKQQKVWVSANPYQLGAFVAYDLEKVFTDFKKGKIITSLADENNTIQEDPFVKSTAFQNYETYRELSRNISLSLEQNQPVSSEKVEAIKRLNSHFWKAYALAGENYYQQKKYKKAVIDLKQALQREVSSVPEKEKLQKLLKKAKRRL